MDVMQHGEKIISEFVELMRCGDGVFALSMLCALITALAEVADMSDVTIAEAVLDIIKANPIEELKGGATS